MKLKLILITLFGSVFALASPTVQKPTNSLRTQELPFGPVLEQYQSLLAPIEECRVQLLPGTLELHLVIKKLLNLEISIRSIVRNVGPRCDPAPSLIELHIFKDAVVLLFVRIQAIIAVLKTYYSPLFLRSTLEIFARIRADLQLALALSVNLGINLDDVLASLDLNMFLHAHIDLLHLMKIDLPAKS
ncbi:secreted protein [Melampsora americana]|nr:secreted protein [Melampsora americana]